MKRLVNLARYRSVVGLFRVDDLNRRVMTLAMQDFEHQLRGGRLTTAEVLYYMPDHPKLLQSFLWQTLDLAPEYPRVHRFLEFWKQEIHAVIHSVSVGGVGIIAPPKVKFTAYEGLLN